MIYFIAAAILLFLIVFSGLFLYMDHVDRKNDLAETLQFRAMNSAQRQEALIKAKHERASAYTYYAHMDKLWRSYKWGYRRNPYLIPYTVAQAEYARACRRVQKLEAIIKEIDQEIL